MQTHSQVDLEIQGPASVEHVLIKDGDLIIRSSSKLVEDTQTPAEDIQKPAKKQTRQWAAWTRQEEENFFNALRQVGKNFEKITCRVQSKNKNQVRHYYYRLVRRMNKLLGPGLSLDAKNSKETIAAMLRWWTLLEKFSCSASKLHLRPRRFKIFIEALESQLLKDRNKTRRKRPSQEENNLATASTTSIPSKAPANDARPAKLLVVDSQNAHKIGATKGTTLKRNVSPNVSSDKGGSSTMKTVRQKRRPAVASAAYKRWEKAAMAGVSLVADAAEQLERAADNRNYSSDRGTFDLLSNNMYTIDGQKDGDSVELASPVLTGMCSHQTRETILQSSMKLKLQLFPIDDGTRKVLEKDAHNPHLELTLSAKKRISSVLEHLNRKWGKSSTETGELMLFPYSIQQEDMASCPRWSVKDDDASASDVYATIGRPSVFRLRYGWFSSAEVGSGIVHTPPTRQFDDCIHSKDIQEGYAMDVAVAKHVNFDSTKPAPLSGHISEQPVESSKDQSTSVVAPVPSVTGTDEPMLLGYSVESMDGLPNSCGQTTPSWLGEKDTNVSSLEQEDAVNPGVRNRGTLSAVEWADSLTTMSVGDLLSEVSRAANSGCVNSCAGENAACLQQISFSCDSFDAAVAAQTSGLQLPSLSKGVPQASIWNDEETCDEFSFKRIPAFKGESSNPFSTDIGACKQIARMDSSGFHGYLKDLRESGLSDDPSCRDQKIEPDCARESLSDDEHNPAKDIRHTDIFWTDSLGLVDLDTPSSRYQCQDMIFGDSFGGGLSRAIASSLDAFQNCSFFGTVKKDVATSETRGASILLDNKIGSED